VFWLIVGIIILAPVIELWTLIKVGELIGAIPTILLVIATGVIGGYLAKREGWKTIRLLRMQLANGELPGDSLLDGAAILAGAVLMITPGFFSDILGFLLLFPYSRPFVRHLVKRWIQRKIKQGKIWYGRW
jgi:UPF0716 protein FxsA